MREKGGKIHYLPICCFWSVGLGIFENEETSKKVCVGIEYWGFSVLFVLGFQENSICTLRFVNILQNGANFTQNLNPGFKKRMRKLNNFRQTVKSPKSWHLMGYCPKNKVLQFKHYTQRIYLTLLSPTGVKIQQITYVTFETISRFSRHSSSVSF